MIKKLETTDRYPIGDQSRDRRGFQHVSSVIERLIRIYQLQGEMADADMRKREISAEPPEPVYRELVASDVSPTQATFGWD